MIVNVERVEQELIALLKQRYGERWEEQYKKLKEESKIRPPSAWWESGC